MEDKKSFKVGEILANSVENLYNSLVKNNGILELNKETWSEIDDKETYLVKHTKEEMYETYKDLVRYNYNLQWEISKIKNYIEFVRKNKEVI